MSALPWLAETPWPTKQLPRDELAERIEHFLATHWMGVLCTYGKNGPIGSPGRVSRRRYGLVYPRTAG